MRNLEYWKQFIELDSEDSLGVHKPKNTNEKLSLGRSLFQRGICHIMVGDDQKGTEYLLNSYILFKEKGSFINYKDCIRQYVNCYILGRENDEGLKYLKKAILDLNNDIYADVIKMGIRDLFIIVRECMGKYFRKIDNELYVSFKNTDVDKYPYELIGDQLIQRARIGFIYKGYMNLYEIILTINAAQKLYKIALDKITGIMKREFYHLRDYINKSDVELRNIANKESLETLNVRKKIRGNIPLYRWQGEILYVFASFLDEVNDRRESLHLKKIKIIKFFDSIINPPQKRESILGFTEEIEWALLRRRYHYFISNTSFSNNAYEMLRKYLG